MRHRLGGSDGAGADVKLSTLLGQTLPTPGRDAQGRSLTHRRRVGERPKTFVSGHWSTRRLSDVISVVCRQQRELGSGLPSPDGREQRTAAQ